MDYRSNGYIMDIHDLKSCALGYSLTLAQKCAALKLKPHLRYYLIWTEQFHTGCVIGCMRETLPRRFARWRFYGGYMRYAYAWKLTHCVHGENSQVWQALIRVCGADNVELFAGRTPLPQWLSLNAFKIPLKTHLLLKSHSLTWCLQF